MTTFNRTATQKGLLSHRLGHGFKLQYSMTCVNAITDLNNAYVTEWGMVY